MKSELNMSNWLPAISSVRASTDELQACCYCYSATYRFFVEHDATMPLQFLPHFVFLYFNMEIILLLSSVFHVVPCIQHLEVNVCR